MRGSAFKAGEVSVVGPEGNDGSTAGAGAYAELCGVIADGAVPLMGWLGLVALTLALPAALAFSASCVSSSRAAAAGATDGASDRQTM